MNTVAYLILWVSADLKTVVGLGVYSEPKPAAMDRRHPFIVTEAAHPDGYAAAKAKLRDRVSRDPRIDHIARDPALWA